MTADDLTERLTDYCQRWIDMSATETSTEVRELADLIAGVKVQTLREMAVWMRTAHANSEGRFSEEYRRGFEHAAGWVEFHADKAELDQSLARIVGTDG